MNKEIQEQILELTKHNIPFYAYGDNEAACELSRRLNEVASIVSQVEPEVKPEICVNTDKLNGSGEYYYNAKLSELFTLNNLIPQLETKVDFVEGEDLAQYEVSQIYYIAKERIAINIYLNEY